MELKTVQEQNLCYSQCGCKCNKVCLESCEGLKTDLFCKLNCGCTPSKLLEPKKVDVNTSTLPQKESHHKEVAARSVIVPEVSKPVVNVEPAKPVVNVEPAQPVVNVEPATPVVNVEPVQPVVNVEPAKESTSDGSHIGTNATTTSTEGDCSTTCTNKCLDKAKDKEETINCFIDCGCFPGFSALELMQSPEAIVLSHASGSSTFGYIFLAFFLISIVIFTGWLVVERDEKKGLRIRDEEASDNMLYEKLE